MTRRHSIFFCGLRVRNGEACLLRLWSTPYLGTWAISLYRDEPEVENTLMDLLKMCGIIELGAAGVGAVLVGVAILAKRTMVQHGRLWKWAVGTC